MVDGQLMAVFLGLTVDEQVQLAKTIGMQLASILDILTLLHVQTALH